MTLVTIDLGDVAGGHHPDDHVIIRAEAFRESQGGGVTSTAEVVIPLVDGVGQAEVEPGPVVVAFRCRAVADTREKRGVVPESGPVGIEQVIYAAFTYTPPVVNRGLDLIEDALDDALADLVASAELVGAVLKEQGDWDADTDYPVGSVVTHEGKRWYGAADIQDVPERTNLLTDPQMRDAGQWSKFAGVTASVAGEEMSLSLASDRSRNNGLIQSLQDIDATPGQGLSAGMLVRNPGGAEITARLWLAADPLGAFDPNVPGVNVPGASVIIPAGGSARVTVTGTMPSEFSSVKLRLSAGAVMLPAGTVLHVSQAIVEKSPLVQDYFDGDSPTASWVGDPYVSASSLPAHRTMDTPSGEPGESASWVLLSALLEDGHTLSITDAGQWASGETYSAGAVVTHDGNRWIGSSVPRDYPDRTNLVRDPKISDDTAWTTYSGVELIINGQAILTATALRPRGNGLMVGSANYQIPVVAGDPISAGIRVENRGTGAVTVQAGFVFRPGSTPSQGADVTIPAGATASVTYSGVVPVDHDDARLALFAGAGGVPAGSVLHVSQAIVEKSPTVGDYFDGDYPGVQWVPERYGAISHSPERQASGPPIGEPGIDGSWVFISQGVDGIDEIVAKLDDLNVAVAEAASARTEAVAASGIAGAQASAATVARTAAETASATALNTRGEISTTATAVQANREHVDAQVSAIDTAFTESIPPYLTKPTLDQSYAAASTVADIEERTAPQKMLFGLPVPKPQRAPNLALMDSYPTPDLNFQILRAEGSTLWAYAMDKSLYKYTPATGWVQKSYHVDGIQTRGGITRCQDGSLLLFTINYTIRRSTDEGVTWTTVQPRRAPGLEPLTTQSIAVEESTGHIYYGEYVINAPAGWEDVVLWRSTDHGATWHTFHTWPRPITGLDGAITHIHGVQYDHIGQDIYIMAGDGTASTGLWRVEGDTCIPVLTNGMLTPGWHDAPRAIGMMFFPDYVAWGSDSTSNPYIFRIPRSALGVDPSKLERGPRMSSTSWGTARASEDGSRWVMFSSDEAFPSHAADRMAHIYSVEDQGATVYEVGAVSSQSTSSVATLQPLAPAHHFSDHFWFGMRTGAAQYGAWKMRLGYGGQTIPWPARSTVPLMQAQSSGRMEIPPATSKTFGVTRAPVYATNLSIFESNVMQLTTESPGKVVVEVVAGGEVVYSSARVSNRQQSRAEHGGALAVVKIPGNRTVEIRLRNTHAGTPMVAVGSVTFAWVE